MKYMQMMIKWAGDFLTDAWGWIGACVGMVISLWTGMPALGKGILIVQGADILSGLACALLGKSHIAAHECFVESLEESTAASCGCSHNTSCACLV